MRNTCPFEKKRFEIVRPHACAQAADVYPKPQKKISSKPRSCWPPQNRAQQYRGSLEDAHRKDNNE